MREVLDGAATAIEERFLDEPLVHASVRETLGRTYHQLGAYEESQRHLEHAIEIYELHNRSDDGGSRELQRFIVMGLLYRWKLDEADSLLSDLLARIQSDSESDHEFTAGLYGAIGILRKRQGRLLTSLRGDLRIRQ